MTAGTGPIAPALRAALDAARVVFGAFDRTPAPEIWRTAQQLLQQVVQRPELTGQALIGEARRMGILVLPDAHALVALATFADRTTGVAATEAERILIREAWMALQHAVPPALFEPMAPVSPYAAPSAPPVSPYAPPSAPPGTPGAAPRSSVAPPPPPASATSPLLPPSSTAAPAPVASVTRRKGVGIALGAALLVALAAGAGWWITTGRHAQRYAEGVAAYQRGAREVARAAFVELAQQQPEDARPLVYLGRMSREDGDLPRARRFLTSAVRVAPGSAIAARELASLMLADAQPEIARRFYVRALELDPADRVAQGFLGCALYRLQRFEEARRWSERAGAGEWQRCIGPMPSVPFAPPVTSPLPPR
jgi:tetratricopeptide (TPR) repeat protein